MSFLNSISVGDRVTESDSGVSGSVIEIHDRWSFRHAVMLGDDGKKYDHNLSHYTKVKKTNHFSDPVPEISTPETYTYSGQYVVNGENWIYDVSVSDGSRLVYVFGFTKKNGYGSGWPQLTDNNQRAMYTNYREEMRKGARKYALSQGIKIPLNL